ncbi:MAG: hypothetical protein C0611_13795 [Desulfobacteraceae bacterium]|nr:MAG: hypothetical protein C0611_13795 [Desulfobacteraceae bacterium]
MTASSLSFSIALQKDEVLKVDKGIYWISVRGEGLGVPDKSGFPFHSNRQRSGFGCRVSGVRDQE